MNKTNSLILLVAPAARKEFTVYHIQDALHELGYNTKIFDYRVTAYRLKSIENMNKKLFQYSNKLKPDLILVLKGELLDPKIIKQLKFRKVLWYFDVQKEPQKWLINLAPSFDIFFTICKDKRWQSYFNTNVKWLPEAYSDKKIHPITNFSQVDVVFSSDVAFIGTDNHKYRAEVLSEIVNEGIDLKIWGNQIYGYWVEYGLTPYWMGYRTTDDEFNKIVSQTKIIIGFSNCQEVDYDTCFSARVYQTLGAKGFLLEQKSKNIESMFKPGVDLDLWVDADDLIKKIFYYLTHYHKRVLIAKNGYKKVKENHTFKKRMEEMLKIVGL